MAAPLGSSDIDDLTGFAVQLADQARDLTRKYFRQPIETTLKSDRTIVTEADTKIETLLRESVHASLPGHSFLGEETGSGGSSDSEFLWVIDPIDGTRSFAAGIATFCTLIALLHAGRPIVGVIDQPIVGDRWIGAADRPTTLNGQEIKSRRTCRSLEQAILATTSPKLIQGEDVIRFERLSNSVHAVMYGLDGYAYGILAAGWLDLVVETALKDHDIMALVPVIEGAGGVVTDWNEDPVVLGFDGHAIAAGNAEIHRRAVQTLRR